MAWVDNSFLEPSDTPLTPAQTLGQSANGENARRLSISSSGVDPSDPHTLSDDSAISTAEAFIPLDNGVCYWNRLPQEIKDEILRYAYGRHAGPMKLVIKTEIDEWNKFEELLRWEKCESFKVSRKVSNKNLLPSFFTSVLSDQSRWQTKRLQYSLYAARKTNFVY